MGDARARASIDYERLAEYLRALSVANRLELLRKLQVPLAVSQIRLAPSREDRERAPDRAISRQAVEKHLDRLQELGLVGARATTRDGLPSTEYFTNHARLFVVLDELRRLSLVRSAVETESRGTDAGGEPRDVSPPEIPPGLALVLASGPLEGTVFPLEGEGPWVIGRERGATVVLPYDPFVSKSNARLWREGDALLIADLAGSRNGTRVNWRTLADGERARVVAGDAIGVGRSLLFLRERRA